MSTIAKKICLIGDFNVGKTSLIRRFVEDKFSDRYLTTIGVKISRKSLIVESEATSQRQVNLLLWDIEGRTPEKAIPASYLKGAHGAIVVGDLSRVDTLERVHNHLDDFMQVNPQGKTVVALNKADLLSPEKLAKINQIYSFGDHETVLQTWSTSAKTGAFVEEIFQQLAAEVIA